MKFHTVLRASISIVLVVIMLMSMMTVALSVSAQENSAADDKDIAVSGSSSFGAMVASEVNTQQSVQNEAQSNIIYSVKVTGKVANAEFVVAQDALLVIAIYTENKSKMLASGKTEITEDMTQAQVEFDTAAMPEYFYLKAFLVEQGSYAPLCKAYSSPNYTKEMREFFEMTTADFPSDRVLNLDEDPENNFAVYKEDVYRLDVTDAKRESVKVQENPDGTLTYVIPNAESEFDKFRKGDVVAYDYDSPDGYLIKIDTVSFSGTTATIKTTDVKLDEAFDIVNIDTTVTAANCKVDDSACGNGVTPAKETLAEVGASESEDWSPSISKSFKLDYEASDRYSISGSLTIGLSCDFKVYLSWTYKYVELSLIVSSTVGVTVTGTVKLPPIYLYRVDSVPVKGVNIGIGVSFIIEASASITYNFTSKATLGFKRTSDGDDSLCSAPKAKPQIKAEGTFFAGFQIEAKAGVGEDTLFASVKGKAGIEAKGSQEWLERFNTSTKKHICTECVDGTLSGKVSITASANVFDFEGLTFKDSWSYADKITDFYWSYSFSEFGFNDCPHTVYLVTVTVKDKEGNTIEGASVTSEKAWKESTTTTDSNGVAKLFLPSGEHSIAVRKSEYKDASAQVYVNGKPTSKQITLESLAQLVTVTVKDKEGNLLLGVSVTSEEALENSVTTTDSSGVAKLYLPDGKHTISVSKSKYKPATCDVTVEGKPLSKSVTLEEIVLVEISEILGYGETAAIVTNSGDLYMAGYNHNGQLGNGSKVNSSTFVKTMGNVRTACVGDNCAAAITTDGDLYMWGYIYSGDETIENVVIPRYIMSNVKTVVLGNTCVAAITNNGDLYTWGNNNYGRLGNGNNKTQYKPVRIMGNVESVSFGYNYSAAITKSGDLYTWGSNEDGQLGNDSTSSRFSPVFIMSNVKSVALGNYAYGGNRTYAITKDGTLYGWGKNHGHLGDGTYKNTEKPVRIMSGVKSVYTTQESGTLTVTYAITTTGTLYGWGSNGYGHIGNGDSGDGMYTSPQMILTGIKDVGIGRYSAAALAENGDLYTWGKSMFGETGTASRHYEPMIIKEDVKLINVGYSRLYAVTNSNELYACGSNNRGTLGDGTTSDKNTLTLIDTSSMLATTKTVATVGAGAFEEDEVTTTCTDADTKTEFVTVGEKVSVQGGTKFTGLEANCLYNFYSVRSMDAEDLLDSSNLLYVDQFVSDENGEITVIYTPSVTDCEEFVVSGDGINGQCFGDVNNDGVVNIKDATAIQKYVAELIKFNSTERRVADFDADGTVTIKDVTAIQKWVAGLT